MSESSAETPELIQIQKPETPQFQVVEQNKEKTPAERLKEVIDSPNMNANQVLDTFENDYIPNTDTFKLNDHDTEIMIFTDLAGKVISDPDFSGSIIDLPNASDNRLDGLPEGIRLHLELDDKGEYGHAQYRKFPEDPRWKRYWKLTNKYVQRALQNPDNIKDRYGENVDSQTFKSSWDQLIYNNYTRWIGEVREKSVGKDLIASGEWLGHGTFLSNLEKMLENGSKIKSAYHVVNSGGKREDIFGDTKGGDAHSASIFFYNWNYQDFRYSTDVVGKYGTNKGGQSVKSDLSIFYPMDTIYRSGVTIGSYLGNNSMSEFFVTKSPELVTENRRFSPQEIYEIAQKDQTELPLDQAYFRVDTDERSQKIKELFTKFGYSEDWVKDHVYLQPFNAGRKDLRNWLSSRQYGKVEMPQYKSVQYGNNYLWEAVK